MGVRAPSDKRFRRSRVKPSGRRLASRLRWRRLGQVFVLLALVAYAVDRAAKLVLNASGLAIDQIEVQGHTQLSTGEVLALVSGLRGQNILTAQIDTWRNRLVMSPWVKDAALRKVMPSKIKITVLEKAPVSLGRVDKELYLIDEHGDVIDKDGPQYDFDLPIVDGLFERIAGQHAEDLPAHAVVDGPIAVSATQRQGLAERTSLDRHNSAGHPLHLCRDDRRRQDPGRCRSQMSSRQRGVQFDPHPLVIDLVAPEEIVAELTNQLLTVPPTNGEHSLLTKNLREDLAHLTAPAAVQQAVGNLMRLPQYQLC